jgi:LysM repeat protein
LTSCRASRLVVSSSGGEADVQAYINKYKDLAISEMNRAGIPASITLAQGMIESDFGRSSLAVQANNHFGIKCHNEWKGPTVQYHDNRRNECFRKYSRPEDSYRDHSDFLRTASRYGFLFDLSPTDYKGWAKGLKRAGYATNPDYANMLIRKIEENSLYYLDTKTPLKQVPAVQVAAANPVNKRSENKEQVNIELVNAEPPKTKPANNDPDQVQLVINDNFTIPAYVNRVMENNRIQYIIVKDGETVDMIEKEFQLLKWELQRYNELGDDFTLFAGQILYLQPKRDKAEIGKETHTVVEGDTMYSVSQKYGIKLKKLYEYNGMAEGEEPSQGQKIWLRTIKPVN